MADWIGTIGGLAGILSVFVAVHQWWKVNKKIAMLTDASKAVEILPMWYTSRMMQDDWLFGLLMNDGRTIAIRKITAISDNAKWMDVELATNEEVAELTQRKDILVTAIAEDRRSASIRIPSIAAAMELQTS